MAANGQRVTEGYQRELIFTDADFDFIRRLVADKTGIALSEQKRELVYGRLAKRLRSLDLQTFAQYCDFVQDDAGELHELVNAITTNLTSFFREPYHFDYLRDTLLPELLRRNAGSCRLRLWSAGCSTGEEPYSIAMVLRDALPSGQGWDAKILATDIDSNVLARAESGIYAEERVKGVPEQYLRRCFRRGQGDNAGMLRVGDETRSLITFRPLNLMQEWPMKGPFDVIFCRNVVIYFDKPTQRRLFNRYADLLVDGGHLFIGHSETLFKVCDRFTLIGRTIYRKL
ncbi:MAG: protein-glutamate O-methyltransferase CheR [Gammaproteobacteria bacterium]|nr:protein-glutamate O-methyltransferase CheR [Gammaproteobacteria bacterium]